MSEPSASQHAVIVYLETKAIEFERVIEIEDELIAAVDSGVGEVDGHELAIDGSEVVYYLYGADADALYRAVEPVIRRIPPPPGSYVVKRYGEADDPSAREVRIEL